MSVGNFTKQAFADALKTLLAGKELEKIRVAELCALCGAERPTFYYHFRDKYDLVAWIYEQDYRRAVRRSGGKYDIAHLERFLEIIRQEQVFYRKACAEHTQNALIPHIYSSYMDTMGRILRCISGTPALSGEGEFALRFSAHAWIGCLLDWIFERTSLTAAAFSREMYRQLERLGLPQNLDPALIDLPVSGR